MYYTRRDFTHTLPQDIVGGITSGVVALPLALAFGIASGAGPMAGLYSAIIVGFFASIFGGTRQQISGPTGPMTVVMTTVILEFTQHYPDQWLALTFTTVILAGLIQIAMGLCKIGKYIVMVPYPVVSGFMSGIGLIIIVLQIPVIFGFAHASSISAVFLDLPHYWEHMNGFALLMALLGLVLLYLWRGKFATRLPAALVILVALTVLSLVMPFADSLQRIGTLPSGLPGFVIPTFNLAAIDTIIVNAFMLAVLGAIDSLLTSLVLDNESGEQHDSEQELIGQGFANTIAGFFAALPGAGATMRSMVNIKAGGQGPSAGVVHSILLLVAVLGLGSLFEHIPQVVLAAILIKVGIEIIDWPFLKRLHKLPFFPVFLMFTVLILTLAFDLITAVLVGVFIKNIDTVKRLSDLQLGDIILSDGVSEQQRLSSTEQDYLNKRAQSTVLMKITGPVSYAVGRGLHRRYRDFKTHRELIIDLSQARIVGYSTALIIIDIVNKAIVQEQHVTIIGVDKSTRDLLIRLGLQEYRGALKISRLPALPV